MTNRSALTGGANHARAPLHPSLWEAPEFFWNFSLGDGAHVHDYSGNGHDGTITGGIESNQFFNDATTGIQRGLRCLRRTGTGGHITGARYTDFEAKAGEAWSFIYRFSISSVADERTIFAYRQIGGATQLLIRTIAGEDPTRIQVFHNGVERIASNNVLELDTPYIVSLTNDGLSGAASMRMVIYSEQGEILDTGTGQPSGDATLTSQIWWVGANHGDTNDPLLGTHCGVYAYSRVLDDSKIQLFADDWLALFRVKRRAIGLVAVAAADDVDPYWIAEGQQQPRFDPPEVVGY